MNGHRDKFYTGAEPSLDDKYRTIYGEKNKNHITREDTVCPCCGVSLVTKEFFKRINRFIDLYGKKIKISSGYRCPRYNVEIGGSKNSAHAKGNGIDIKEESARAKRKMVRIADKMEFVGIGVYNKHIHLDDNPRWHESQVLWSGKSV